ncbi:hypothetical protein THAOC_02428 [Thalassiosira oceanica]|uniref:Integrase catalytic domain-containing protein n=1 Tax=Thalassiosira oceanica TaxID=159749 RepID=K0TFL4_THAOC|nr:hypothetical protein THAOC_02428 [Thalassiosira oceanica]|eukprot:EJK75839.1 hypothetical protein THAOC_02428 [Thalassiosira oceanica]
MMVTALLFLSSSRCQQFLLTDRVPPDPNGPWTHAQSLAVLGVMGVPLLLSVVGWMESVYGGVPEGLQWQLIGFGGCLWLTALRSVLAYLPWDVWLFSDFSTGIVLHIPGIEDGHPGVCSGVITPQYKRFKRGGRQLIWVTTRFGSALPGPFWASFLFGLWLCVDLLAKSTREFLCCRFGSLRASALTIFGLLAECSGSPLGVADGPDFSDVDDAPRECPARSTLSPNPPAEAVSDDVGDTEPSPFVLDWASDWFILLQVLLCFGLPILWTLRRSVWWHLAFDSLVLLVTFGGLQAASFRTFEHGDVTRLESPHLLAYDLAYTFVSDALSALWRASLVLPSSGSPLITLGRAVSLSLLLRVGPVALFGWFSSPPTGPSCAAPCPLPSPPADDLLRLPSSPLWWDPLFSVLHPPAFDGLYADGVIVELPPPVTCSVPYPDLGACSAVLDEAVLSESTRRAIADNTRGRLPDEVLHPDDAPPPEPPPFQVSRWLGSFDPSRIMDTLSFQFDRGLKVGCALRQAFPARCLTALHGAPLIVDTGASVCVTPTRDDFVSYEPCDVEIKDLSSKNRVAGRGLVRWTVVDSRGLPCTLQAQAYHVPGTDVRLLSPQRLFDHMGGTGSITNQRVILSLASGRVLHADICKHSRLPILPLCPRPNATVSALENVFSVQTEHLRWFVAGEKGLRDARDIEILHDSNTNLSASQKEFLRWHERLSHASFSRIYMLMRTVSWLKSDHEGVALHRGPFIPCEHKVVTIRDMRSLRCVACLEAKAHIRSPDSRRAGGAFRRAALEVARTQRLLSDDEFKQLLGDFTRRLEGRAPPLVLKRGDLSPGDCISMDHYSSSTMGRLPNSFGREANGYTCGTLFVDHASGKIFNYCQHSTTAEETVQNKHRLETDARIAGITIKKYHADNGSFDSQAFRDDCDLLSQQYDFSAPHSQFQNGVAERNIGTIMRWARANLLHLARHWPRGSYDYSRLWPFAVDYAIWVFNRLPRMDCGVCPEELWCGGRGASRPDDFARAHKFGCPVFVLDNDLADGHRIPRWHPRARLGMFLGFSPDHSSLAPLVLNLATGKITVCFHAIFDDDFTTVVSTALDRSTPLDDAWQSILTLDSGREAFLDPEEMVDEAGRVVPLDPVWCPEQPDHGIDALSDVSGPVASRTRHQLSDLSEGVSAVSEGATSAVSEGAVASRTRSAAAARALTVDDARRWGQPPPHIAARSVPVRSTLRPPGKWRRALMETLPILKDAWSDVGSDFRALHQHIVRDPFDSRLVESFDPRVLAARSSKYNEDNPSWTMAMQGEYQHEYFQAMETEIRTLDDDMHCWDYVERTPGMKVLPSTWAFKCKRYPDGRVKKFKARFVVRGDCQTEGVDFFETWAPVAQWATVRTMMVLASKLQLKSAQCDITAAFVHAPLPPEEEIFVAQPRGLNRGSNLVLRLNKSLYGLKQAPRHFFSYLGDRLQSYGLTPSEHDPCLFLSRDLIVVVYVDDLLVYSRSDDTIADFVSKMKEAQVDIRLEGTAEGFLGVDVARQGTSTVLTQRGLTERVIQALGLDPEMSNKVETPALSGVALGRDVDGEPAFENFNYASVVGMLLYLCGHSRPDIAFAVHQCARYSFAPKRSHELALIRIGRYLKGTLDGGLILDPTDDLRLDCYPDADFAGLWGHEHPQDPHCVRSRTGFLINLSGCPVVWSSKLQSEIALSTMEAEYVALSTACRSLFPVVDLLREIGLCLDLPVDPASRLHIEVHEDNVGALTLGRLEPRRMTPRSKHYAVKYHWFRSQLGPRNVVLTKIASEDQLGDIFTKGLGAVQFKVLRKRIMGW